MMRGHFVTFATQGDFGKSWPALVIQVETPWAKQATRPPSNEGKMSRLPLEDLNAVD